VSKGPPSSRLEREPKLVQRATRANARTLVLGTRGSQLARRQTDRVIELLAAAHPGLQCRAEVLSTAGDRSPDLPLPSFGDRGVFTRDIEEALRDGRLDAAVHSLKDLPTETPRGLVIAAICERADPREVLISREYPSLAALPQGARVGTSSVRRAAQLLAIRPDLRITALRGNVETRVRKALNGDYDAVVIAAAGVIRLGLQSQIRETLPLEVALPAPGQGALAVQCRGDDPEVLPLLQAIDDAAARAATTAERAMLEALGGGCHAPVGAFAQVESGRLRLQGLVASADGRHVIRVEAEGATTDARNVGRAAADKALAAGAAPLLA